jgi:hypothetical protein
MQAYFLNRSNRVAALAAQAAKQSADTAAEAFTLLERPYVLPGAISIAQSQAHTWYATCRIGNYGRTPAIIHDILEGFSGSPIVGANPSDPEFKGGKKRTTEFNMAGVLASGSTLPNSFEMPFPAVLNFNTQTWRLTYAARLPVFLVINVRYEDVKGIVRRRRFTWKYHDAYRRFLRFAGDEYNFENVIKPGDDVWPKYHRTE